MTWSLLVTVTVAPGATVTVVGEKAKLWMVIESELEPPPLEDALVVALADVDDALLPPDEHATGRRPSRRGAAEQFGEPGQLVVASGNVCLLRLVCLRSFGLPSTPNESRMTEISEVTHTVHLSHRIRHPHSR